MNRHRILLVTENYPPDRGGMSESCDRISRNLSRNGVQIDLVHFDHRVTDFRMQRTLSGSVLRAPLSDDPAHATNLLWNRLGQEIDLTKTTHVVAFGGNLPIAAAPLFAAWIGIPLVTLLRGNELDAGLFTVRKRPMLDEAIRRAAAVVTVTSDQKRRVESYYGIDSVSMITNGIDLDLWQLTEADRAAAKKWREMNVAAGRRVIGLFGHLKSKKGVSLFLDSLLRSGAASQFHLLLIGEIEPEVHERLTTTEISSTVLEPLDRLSLLPWYAACDLVGIPSHYDGCPNVLVEASALGVPVIGSSVGGMRDLLVDGESGILFPPTNVETCARAIASAARLDDDTLRALGARARATVLQRCAAETESRHYVEVLDITATSRNQQIARGE